MAWFSQKEFVWTEGDSEFEEFIEFEMDEELLAEALVYVLDEELLENIQENKREIIRAKNVDDTSKPEKRGSETLSRTAFKGSAWKSVSTTI